ncbi:NmrA family NAD(P)-binding protein [Streptomyces sp. NA02950]|uniref:SDR family oxidoreductase n=1 Tax=Streptomyces sp. NA02950 TaxID=2742137 RepID=UPI001591738B|nr:NmrA family NAD(P)-binding protein [Streptomyces sp. NA02950]QKV90489.1 NmrA family NAD(P)-binding protein [Streptomyces sp. NA02950]
MTTTVTVLVTGAAGDQGVAATRHLRAAGHAVRAVDAVAPDSPRAAYLTRLGVEYRQGDLADDSFVADAVSGADVVFAVPVGPIGDEILKFTLGAKLIEAAERADVSLFLQTSVAALERHLLAGDYGTGHTYDAYAVARLHLEARLRNSSLNRWTVLRPVLLMENFLPPKSIRMFPWLTEGRIDSTYAPDQPQQLVSVVDVARYAVAAIAQPDRFHRHVIELNGDEITMDAIADAIGRATGTTVTYSHLPLEQALKDGVVTGVAHSQEWAAQVGYAAPAPSSLYRQWGITPTSFEDWSRAHADTFNNPR